MVEVNDLNQRAGERIAQLTGAEAGFVCSGAAGGLVLQAAACIAGTDPFRMRQLPDTTGMKNEIIIQNCHRFAYDQAYRAAGAKLVGVGDGRRTQAWELEGAITESTAAIAYLFSNHLSRRAMGLEEMCQIAHKHDVPVIVDGASMLPPRANLTRYLEQGADMVVFSGGKGIRGPQGTGILCGRADLIAAAAAQANPNQFLARPMKVSKEEVVGLVTALELFVDEDDDTEFAAYRKPPAACRGCPRGDPRYIRLRRTGRLRLLHTHGCDQVRSRMARTQQGTGHKHPDQRRPSHLLWRAE